MSPSESITGEAARTRAAYEEAAAVLVDFEPGALRPHNAAPDEGILLDLLNVCDIVYDEERVPYVVLPEAIRIAALQRLGSAEQALAVALNNPARRDTSSQRLLESYLRGEARPIEKQSREELAFSLESTNWLSELTPTSPIERIQSRINLDSLVAPLRHLIADVFVGRTEELARLHAHRTSSGSDTPLLMVTGIGGVGKSTLLAQFLLDRTYARTILSDGRLSCWTK